MLTIFDSKHVIPYGIFNDNCLHLIIYALYTQEENLSNGEDDLFFVLNLRGGLAPPPFYYCY